MSDDTPDMDLIGMVQRARMAHDSQAKPSQVDAVYWIEAKPHNSDSPAPTPRAGEFVIETDTAGVDTLWERIRDATQAGTLGYKSKVATISRTGDPHARLIMVRTVDAQDSADVERVRNALTQLGIAPARYVRIIEADAD